MSGDKSLYGERAYPVLIDVVTDPGLSDCSLTGGLRLATPTLVVLETYTDLADTCPDTVRQRSMFSVLLRFSVCINVIRRSTQIPCQNKWKEKNRARRRAEIH